MENNFGLADLPAEPETWFVCLIGIAVVLVGLVLLIGIVYLMNFIIGCLSKKKQTDAVPPVTEQIENRQEIIAAVCAAIAEENGTDISAVRVISFKKIQN